MNLKTALLLIAIGNPSRGDDALGPALLALLAAQPLDPARVECLTDFQLQIEHALDLAGRQAVLFVDAARPGVLGGDGVALLPVAVATAQPALSHALTPAAVLQVVQRLGQTPPPSWALAIEGESFALGEGLSAAAAARLPRALALALNWIEGFSPRAAA